MGKKNTPHGSSKEAYAVGRGKPPQATRFQPGQSGNPGGRKKGTRNLKTIFGECMERDVELSENGQKRTVSMLEAVIMKLAMQALQGDVRAAKCIVDKAETYQGGDTVETSMGDLSAEDQALLDALKSSDRYCRRPSREAIRKTPPRRRGKSEE